MRAVTGGRRRGHLSVLVHDSDTGESICACRGLVLEESMPDMDSPGCGQERESTTYQSACPVMHDRGLGSVILGNSPLGRKMRQYQRYGRLDPAERRMFVFSEPSDICKRYGFPGDVRRTACSRLRYLERRNLISGRTRMPLLLVLVFVTLEILGRRMPLKEFLRSYVEERHRGAFRRNTRLFRGELRVRTDMRELAVSYMRRYAAPLTRSRSVYASAEDAIGRMHEDGRSWGRDPRIVAATALYVAAGAADSHSPAWRPPLGYQSPRCAGAGTAGRPCAPGEPLR